MEMYDTLLHRLLELAQEQPDKTAIVFKEETVSYSKLVIGALKAGQTLKQWGIHTGDRVLLRAVSRPETAVIYMAIQSIGAIAVFVDKNANEESVMAIYRGCEASLLITDKSVGADANLYPLKELYQDAVNTAGNVDISEFFRSYEYPDKDAVAEMIYTTGTTGVPKGVMLSYKAVYHILNNTAKGIGVKTDDIMLLPLPLNHSFALRVFRAYLYVGATVVLQNGISFGMELKNNQEKFHCTALALVPAAFETLEGQMQDQFSEIMGKFRYIEVSAGSLTLRQRKYLTGLLQNTVIYNTWGSSESGGALFINVTEAVHDEKKASATGKPWEGVEVCTLDEKGNPFDSDEKTPGRMAIKGDMVMSGYWGMPELSAATLKDGWLLTSDMVYIDTDGYVHMLGRADDMINVGGEKVSPVEVENVAGQFPAVRECACIGVPDESGILGMVPALFIVSRQGIFQEEQLKKFLAGKLERYKLPKEYIVVKEIPRNAMKKIDRKALLQMWKNKSRPGGIELMNPVMQVLLTRRSIRNFTDQDIPDDILQMILEAGIYAPSGHNMQTWRFTVVRGKDKIEELRQAAKTAAIENKVYFYGFENPKVLVLVSNDNRNPYGCQDASAAAENMFLAAWSYGIGSVWLNPLMTLRSQEPVKSLLDSYGIPENHTVWCMAAFGYPAADGKLLAKKRDIVKYI